MEFPEFLLICIKNGQAFSCQQQCSERPCPCRTEAPEFCEVVVRKKLREIEDEPNCRIRDICKVALAAEQVKLSHPFKEAGEPKMSNNIFFLVLNNTCLYRNALAH